MTESKSAKEKNSSLSDDAINHCRCRKFTEDHPVRKDVQEWKHIHARESDHRLPKRLDVPDSFVSWSETWSEYDEKVENWSIDATDFQPVSMRQNNFKWSSSHNTSLAHQGDVGKNPYGRTGLRGRGILPRLGANPAAEPVITRSVMFNGGKQTQVLVCRQFQVQGHTFALPGGLLGDSELEEANIMIPGSKKIQQFLESILTSNFDDLEEDLKNRMKCSSISREEYYNLQQALVRLGQERKRSLVKLDLALKSGRKVYPNNRYGVGYCDDPRNTDDAWVEAQVYHFHISGAASGHHDLFAIHGARRLWDVENSRREKVKMEFRWLNVDKGSMAYRMLYASSKFFVDLCLPECRCGRTVFDRQDGSHRCLKYTAGPRELARSIVRGHPPEIKYRSEYHQLLTEHERVKLTQKAWVHTAALQPPSAGCEKFHLKGQEVPWEYKHKEYERAVVRGSRYDLDCSNSVKADAPPATLLAQCRGDDPRNPIGRTGARGRGELRQPGANPARHAVITRVDGSSGRTQVLLWKTQQGDSSDWYFALPNSLIVPKSEAMENDQGEPNILVLDFLKAVLARNIKEGCRIDARDCVTMGMPTGEELIQELEKELSEQKITVYPDGQLYKSGYFDDPRNTDDAWIETEVRHYHLPVTVSSALNLDGLVAVNPWRPKGCLSPLFFKWVEVASTRTYSEQLFAAGVCFFLELCVPDCMCGLPKYDTTDGIHESKKASSAVEFLMNRPLSSAASALEELSSLSQLEYFKAEKVQGLVQFEGRSAVAKFVRAAVVGRRDAVAVCRALFGGTRPQVGLPESWSWDEQDKFWRPKAIISVTGGAQAFDLDRNMRKKIFADGILKTAVAMKALIIDGGTSAGVMEMVGDAVSRENRVAALGICPWGAVLGKQHLLYSSAEKNAALQKESTISAYKVSDDHRNSEWGARLDPDHQYFALVDTGLHGGKKAFESEIYGRVWIEKELSFGGPTSKFVPHVLVVVNGGPGTIKTVHTLSFQGNKDVPRTRTVPIVAVEGTKRAADMLAQCWRHLHEGGSRTCTSGHAPRRCCVSFVKPRSKDGKGETIHCPFLRKAYMKCFSQPTTKPMERKDEEYLAMIVAVCRVKERVTVYNCNMSTSLRQAIMKAVLTSHLMHRKNMGLEKERQGSPDQESNPLEMLLEWEDVEAEAVELAKSELVGITEGDASYAPNYRHVLHKAIIQNKHRFVEVLHESGFVADTTRLQKAIDIEHLIQYGSGPLDYEAIMKKYLGWSRIEWRKQVSCCPSLSSTARRLASTQSEASLATDDGRDRFEKFEEMFLWSIVQGRREIAEIYFRSGHPSSRQHSIARALFACSVSRRISQSSAFRGSARDRDKLEALASHFEGIASDILDRCARLSQRSAASSLTVPFFQPWIRSDCGWVDGNEDFLTPIGMAYTACALSVVKHDAFQECLDRIWFGRLVSDLEKEHTASMDLFRGTLVQLPQVGASWPGNAIASVISVFGTFAVNGVVIFFIAFLPFLSPLLKIENHAGKMGGLWSGLAHKLCAFYTAPCTKFILSFWSYLCFVILYTCVGFAVDRDYTPLEGVMHAWILALYVAEARQCKCEGLRLWVSNGSNILDALMLLAYLPAFSLRMCELQMSDKDYRRLGGWSNGVGADLEANSTTASYEHSGGDFRMARSWHGIAGIFFWIRIFYFLRVSSTLGPLWVVLVKVTCKDVVYFVIFLVVFLVSFGAAIICAARPSHDPSMPFSEFLSHTFYFPYMAIFGEHFLDDSPYFSSHPGGATEQDNRVLDTVLLCIYLLFSTIVLMNLLIARECFYPFTVLHSNLFDRLLRFDPPELSTAC
jgi:hypothetical protein